MGLFGSSDYYQIWELDFTNSSWSVVTSINRFIASASEIIDIQAIYLEMNGFYINPERWYFDLFGYNSYPADPEKLDWLSDWQFDTHLSITLTGLEPLQKTYLHHQDLENISGEMKRLIELTDLAVVLKFMKLIQKTLSEHKLIKNIPVLSSAHDFDLVYRFHTTPFGKLS